MTTQPERPYKRPVSVLVLLYSPAGRVLLLERADKAGYWQSVTGSVEAGETPFQAALREVAEETGFVASPDALCDWHYCSEYEIYPHWRHRYPPGTTRNTEHVFSLCLAETHPVRLAAGEHVAWGWYEVGPAADKVFSPSNRDALLRLPQYWHAACLFRSG